jgi:hypothetical protein
VIGCDYILLHLLDAMRSVIHANDFRLLVFHVFSPPFFSDLPSWELLVAAG